MIRHLSEVDVARYSDAADGHRITIPARQRRHLFDCEQCRGAVMDARRRKETLASAFREIAGAPPVADLEGFRRRLKDSERNPVMLIPDPGWQTQIGDVSGIAIRYRIAAAVGALFTAGILIVAFVHRLAVDDSLGGRPHTQESVSPSLSDTIVVSRAANAAVDDRDWRHRDLPTPGRAMPGPLSSGDIVEHTMSSGALVDQGLAAILPPMLRAEFVSCLSDNASIDEVRCARIVGRARYVSEQTDNGSVIGRDSDSVVVTWPAIEDALYRRRSERSTLER